MCSQLPLTIQKTECLSPLGTVLQGKGDSCIGTHFKGWADSCRGDGYFEIAHWNFKKCLNIQYISMSTNWIFKNLTAIRYTHKDLSHS